MGQDSYVALRVKIGCITTDLNNISVMDILINPRGLHGELPLTPWGSLEIFMESMVMFSRFNHSYSARYQILDYIINNKGAVISYVTGVQVFFIQYLRGGNFIRRDFRGDWTFLHYCYVIPYYVTGFDRALLKLFH